MNELRRRVQWVSGSPRRVHFYNGGMLRQRERAGRWAEVVDPYVVRPEQWPVWRTIWDSLNSWDSLLDRTGSLPHVLDVESVRPMPAFDHSFDQSLEALCLGRAREILAEQKPIRVFWSGGIDSTLVLTSFLMAGAPLDQLELIFTRDSVTEYPTFLSEHAPAALRRTEVTTFPHHNFVPDQRAHEFLDLPCMGDFIDPKVLNVTGGLGDKLFNSHGFLSRFKYASAFEPFERVVPRPLIAATEALMQASPLPIRTVSNFTWWLQLALDYQGELLQILAGISGASVAAQRKALRVFYDTAGFQQWALHHRDRLATDDPARLKLEAKQIIFTYTGDERYLNEKRKSGSLKFRKTPNVAWDEPILFILSDGSAVRPGALSST